MPSADVSRPVVGFYPLSERDVGRLRGTSGAVELRRIVRQLGPPTIESDPGVVFASLLTFLEDEALLDAQREEYEDVLLDLGEFIGGGWELIEVSPSLVEQFGAITQSASAMARYKRASAADGHPPARALAALATLERMLTSAEQGSVLLMHMTERSSS